MALIGLLFLHKIQPLEIQMQFLKKYFEFKKKAKLNQKIVNMNKSENINSSYG